MKTATLILTTSLLFFLSAPLEAAHERAGDTWSLKQKPSGTLMVDGVTYIPSQAKWESTEVLSLREGEVLKLKKSCTTRPAGVWKNTKVCTWEKEIHDRGSYVEERPGGRTEATGLNARIFALLGIILMPVFLLASKSRLEKATDSQRTVLGAVLILPMFASMFTELPMPFSSNHPEPWTSLSTSLAGFASFFAAMATPVLYSLERLRGAAISALVFLGCMVFIAIFT